MIDNTVLSVVHGEPIGYSQPTNDYEDAENP